MPVFALCGIAQISRMWETLRTGIIFVILARQGQKIGPFWGPPGPNFLARQGHFFFFLQAKNRPFGCRVSATPRRVLRPGTWR